jgi:hypothetical protein
MKTGAELIAEERKRQMEVEGYTTEHDDLHRDGSLAIAGQCYWDTAGPQLKTGRYQIPPCFIHKRWPWQRNDFKPSNNPLINMVKAGALYQAEAERLVRVQQALNRPQERASLDMLTCVEVVAAAIDGFWREWFDLLKKICVEKYEFSKGTIDSFDEGAWQEYWLDGFTAQDAIMEDLTA